MIFLLVHISVMVYFGCVSFWPLLSVTISKVILEKHQDSTGSDFPHVTQQLMDCCQIVSNIVILF